MSATLSLSSSTYRPPLCSLPTTAHLTLKRPGLRGLRASPQRAAKPTGRYRNRHSQREGPREIGGNPHKRTRNLQVLDPTLSFIDTKRCEHYGRISEDYFIGANYDPLIFNSRKTLKNRNEIKQ